MTKFDKYKLVKSKYPKVCFRCDSKIKANTDYYWNELLGTNLCLKCSIPKR